MNNYFEETNAELPYDVYNERIALFLNTHEIHQSMDTLFEFLINQQKFEENNIFKLTCSDATIENFNQTSKELSKLSDRNSLFFAFFEWHGD